MATAERTSVDWILQANLCEDCPIGEKLRAGWISVITAGPSASGLGTEIYFNDGENTEGIATEKPATLSQLEAAANNCKKPVIKKVGKSACGIIEQINTRRIGNGREEIRAEQT